MENVIHIGAIIKKKVEESKMSIAEFAEKIYCDRTTVYDLFKRSNIDIERLIRISKVLEYDFIEKVYLQKKPSGYKPVETEDVIESDDAIVYISIPIRKKELGEIKLPENALLLLKDKKSKE